MRLKIVIPLVLILAALQHACKDDGGPPPQNGVDTTSHSFAFSFDTLGDGNSSVLSDVAIISENNVWAVGELYLKDSTGQFDQTKYNLVRWDGHRWRYERVQFPVCNNSGQEIGTSPFAAQCIFAFGANDVWIASLATVVHWNGSGFQRICMPPGSLQGSFKKIWGFDGKLYLVGTNGNITFYDGSTWQKLASGTTVDIQDIWGTSNGQTGLQTILAVGLMGPQIPQARKILRIQNNQVTFVPDSGLPLDLEGVWFSDTTMYYVVGEGVFTSQDLNSWQRNVPHPSEYKEAIRGNGWNDIFVVGSFGLVSHYSGSGWKHYTGNELPSFWGKYQRVAFSANQVLAVGWRNDKAVVLRGRRN